MPPIKLGDGRTFKTLADCWANILALPKREQVEPHWQAATAVLLQTATHGGRFVMVARRVSRTLRGIEGVEPHRSRA